MASNKNNEVNITFKAFNTDFNKSMKEMNGETSALRQQMKLQAEEMKHSATETEKLEASLNSLQQIYEVAQRKTEATAEALARVKETWGENSEQAKKYEAQLRRQQIAEQQASNAILETQQALEQARQAQKEHENSLQSLNNLLTITGNSVNDFSNVIGQDLTNAINNGSASAKDLDKAFELIARSAIESGASVEEIRRTLSRLDGSNIQDIRRDLQQLSESAEEVTEEVRDLGDAFKVLGGVVAGVGLAKAIESALDVSDLDTTIDIAFNIDESSKGIVRQSIADVQKYGVDGEQALEGVRRQWALNAEATDEANQKIVDGAASLTKAYRELDFVELIQEVNEIAGELKTSDEEALNLVNDLLKIGFPTSEIDVIAEYGGQLQRAGYEAERIKAIMASAVSADSFNIDVLLDGLKEGRIRASEMGRGLSDSFKDTIREVTSNTKKMTDEQIDIMSDGFAKQEDAFARSQENQVNALSKSHDKQKRVLEKQLQAQYNSASKAYDAQVSALEKKLSKEYDAVVKNYDKQQRELEKSLSNEVKEYEKATNEKIALIDKEYTEKLKLIDEEKYNQIKALDAQIDALNAKTEAEDKALKQRENAEKRAELQRRINEAKTVKDRADAQKDLRDFEEKLRLDAVREQRKEQIDALKDQKDVIKEQSDAQKDALKSELDVKKEQLKEQAELEKEALQERQDEQKRLFQEQKQAELSALQESNRNQINAMREVNRARLDSLREEQSARKDALNERLSDEMTAVRDAHKAELDSFKQMNKQKLELAKNPPDSAATLALFAQLEGWGQAIAKGGEEGTKAFEDMARWLDTIDNATLRNAIGTEIYGTKWEDEGENIIKTLTGVDDASKRLEETQSNVAEQAEKMGDGSALIAYQQAVQDTKVALTPLLQIIASVVGKVAEWASKNPGLTASIVAIGSVVGILIGALSALSPIILTVVSLFGGGAGLSGVMGKVMPVITNIASKVLPGLRLAFGALTGPVGIVITILTTAVPLIIKHWDSIVEFFVAIGKGIYNAVSGVFKGVYDFLKTILSSTWNFIKDIVGKIADKFSFKDVSTNVKNTFNKLYSFITSPLEKARDAVRKIIDKIKSFFDFKLEFPEFKIPKLTIKKGSLNPLKWFTEGFPEIEIQWMAKGGIMTRPTMIGANGNTAYMGGEAGREAVIPLNERVLASIGNAIFDASSRKESVPQQTVYSFERMLDGATIHVREEADIKRVARELYNYTKANARGGRQ